MKENFPICVFVLLLRLILEVKLLASMYFNAYLCVLSKFYMQGLFQPRGF